MKANSYKEFKKKAKEIFVEYGASAMSKMMKGEVDAPYYEIRSRKDVIKTINYNRWHECDINLINILANSLLMFGENVSFCDGIYVGKFKGIQICVDDNYYIIEDEKSGKEICPSCVGKLERVKSDEESGIKGIVTKLKNI